MHQEPRNGPIRKIVVHDNEGPEGANSAAGLAAYLHNNGPDGGGYQVTFDGAGKCDVVDDQTVCWANGAVNHESIDGCVVGYAAQSAADWADAFDVGALEHLAQWIAAKCVQYGIPARWLSAAELNTPGSLGVTTHGDLTLAGYHGTQGHTDPGPNFPRDSVMARVQAIIMPPAPQPDWNAVRALTALVAAVTARTVKLGDKGPRVAKVQQLLAKHAPKGTDLGTPGVFGAKMAAVVRRYKIAHGLQDTNGDAVGRACLISLLKK